tara:strand:+ start:2057 stop:2755 length:699 start_codon:yes stop_codon:yes gene_type:complete
MFQYAAVYALAKKLKMKPMANISASTLKDCFILGGVDDAINEAEFGFVEDSFCYDENVLTINPTRNTDLLGYYQTQRYFSDCEDDIRSEFFFKKEIREAAAPKIPEGVLVSLHVRRTDYTILDHVHKNQTQEYYQVAMENFPHHRPVVFSDDIEWCKQNMKWLKNDPVFVSNHPFEDLFLMSMCNAHIIANSSFSWWGAWLGQGETVAPERWFGNAGPDKWDDIYCEGWILV